MAHPEQQNFVSGVAAEFPEFFHGTNVLEIGSRNVNGTVRQFFQQSKQYIGIDCRSGPMVDVVSLAHEYKTTLSFDVVISCEAFEHDPHLDLTARKILDVLRPGGLFVMTCAGENRPEHGTRKTGRRTYGPDPNFYRGVSASRFVEAFDPKNNFDPYSIRELQDQPFDLYFWGIRKQ